MVFNEAVLIGVLVVIVVMLGVLLVFQRKTLDYIFEQNGELRDLIGTLVGYQYDLLKEQDVNRLKFDEKCLYEVVRRVEIIEGKLGEKEKKIDVYVPERKDSKKGNR